jgi:hypothetical protein
MAPSLRPCRNNVLEFDYMRGRLSDDWLNPQVVLVDETLTQANRDVVDGFLARLEFRPDEGSPGRTDIQRHEVCVNVPLVDVLSQLLVPFRVVGSTDSQKFTGLLLQLSRALEANPNESCALYRMSPGATRSRQVDDDGQIINLYQGEAPVTPRDLRGTVYPGDRRVRAANQVTVQVHSLLLTQIQAGVDREVQRNVKVLAVFVPARMARAWLVQNQPAQVT